MIPRPIGSSPAAAFTLAMSLLVASTFGYEALVSRPAQAEAPEEGAEVASSLSAARAHSVRRRERALPTIPDVRPPPRLRAPHADDDPPGMELALEDLDGHSMSHFHRALERAASGGGQARLLFWGASHTAADWYTGTIRRALQGRFGDAGHGFVLPVKPWRTYGHLDVDIASNREVWDTLKIGRPPQVLDHYGIAGVAVESDTEGAYGLVSTEENGPVGEKVEVFDLYYLEQPGGGHFDVVIDGEHVRRIDTDAESRRAAFATFRVEDGSHSLKIIVRGDGLVRVFGVSLERDVPGVIVDTHGINGARARSQLLWEDSSFRAQLRRRDPDLVVLAYGTNESGDVHQPIEQYARQLREVVGRIRETVPDASCLLIGPSDRPVRVGRNTYEDRPRTAQIVETQWRVALEQGCAFFDMVAWQGGPLSMVEWNAMNPPYAAPDHVHFTRRGYERFGEVLLGALLEGYEERPQDAPLLDEDEAHASR